VAVARVLRCAQGVGVLEKGNGVLKSVTNLSRRSQTRQVRQRRGGGGGVVLWLCVGGVGGGGVGGWGGVV